MKKFSITICAILALILVSVNSCNRDEVREVSAGSKTESINSSMMARDASKITGLLNSETFLRHSEFFQSFGNINEDSIFHKNIDVYEYNTDYFNIPLYDNENNEIAYVEVVKIENNQFLPNEDEYVMNLIDKSNYNRDEKIGFIEMYDVNYDYYKHATILAENDSIVSWNATGLSEDLKIKYASIQNPMKQTNLKKRHLCDYNGNNNISWGECYSCMDNAISTNPTSTTICWYAQFFGPRVSWCGLSVSIACAYISSVM